MASDNPPRKRYESGQRPGKPGLYLALFHGRKDKRAVMDDFGFAGPLLGPLQYCHTTYLADIKILFDEAEDAQLCCGSVEQHVILSVVDDMIHFEDAYYGDWSVFTVSEDECELPKDTFRHQNRRNLLFSYRSRADG